MKSYFVAALAAVVFAVPALAVGPSKISTMACCMQGLSKAEVKEASAMEKAWTKAEQAAWNKRCSLCMADPHTMLMKMEKSGMKPTEAQIHAHMVSGLSKSEASAMDKILADKKHHALLMKMVENCCMYGVKHAPKHAASR